jgi:hypothetical protein
MVLLDYPEFIEAFAERLLEAMENKKPPEESTSRD